MLRAALVWYLVVVAVTAVLVFAFYRFARGAFRRPRHHAKSDVWRARR